jgi:hypothetical protein
MPVANSPPGGGPKPMSSRLLTMKFMQRGAASSSPTSPAPTPEEPFPKRRKKNNDSPITPKVKFDEETNRRTLEEAEKAEEARREAALERLGVAAGDTRWHITYPDQLKTLEDSQTLALRVVETGYASLDIPIQVNSEDGGRTAFDEQPVMVGRRSFGKFNQALEVCCNMLIRKWY